MYLFSRQLFTLTALVLNLINHLIQQRHILIMSILSIRKESFIIYIYIYIYKYTLTHISLKDLLKHISTITDLAYLAEIKFS